MRAMREALNSARAVPLLRNTAKPQTGAPKTWRMFKACQSSAATPRYPVNLILYNNVNLMSSKRALAHESTSLLSEVPTKRPKVVPNGTHRISGIDIRVTVAANPLATTSDDWVQQTLATARATVTTSLEADKTVSPSWCYPSILPS